MITQAKSRAIDLIEPDPSTRKIVLEGREPTARSPDALVRMRRFQKVLDRAIAKNWAYKILLQIQLARSGQVEKQ